MINILQSKVLALKAKGIMENELEIVWSSNRTASDRLTETDTLPAGRSVAPQS